MGRRIGLIYKARGMPSAAKQLRALVDSGVAEGDAWEDDAKRHLLKNWLLSGRIAREGDTLVVATLNALGDTTRKQNAARKKLEREGVTVEVSETDEGPKRSRGRPAEHNLTAEQQKTICGLWWDRNIPRQTVIEQAEQIAGKPISESTIKRICGLARAKPGKGR